MSLTIDCPNRDLGHFGFACDEFINIVIVAIDVIVNNMVIVVIYVAIVVNIQNPGSGHIYSRLNDVI